jgi:hypothetical protein
MKSKMINIVNLEGWVYDHKLTKKVSGATSKNPGTEFINGTIDIVTDDAGLNVVTIHYSYVTAVTKQGKSNSTYVALNSIIENEKTVIKVGKENATKVRANTSIGLNEFYSDRTGKEELVSAKRNEGGFIHIITDALEADENKRNTWEADTVITKVREVEADPERKLAAKVIISGYVFDFRNALLPVDFVAYKQSAQDYFLGLEASEKNPTFIKLKGSQISQTVIRTVTEESAFGDEPDVKEFKNTVREFVVTRATPPYEWDSEDTITVQEMKEALANREITKAEIKKRQDDYQASRAAAATTKTTVNDGDYKF